MTTYVVAEIDCLGHYLWMLGLLGKATEEIAEATKFNTVCDATLHAERHRCREGSYTILGILPWAIAEAEARAQHDWSHRHCHNGRVA